MAMQFEYALFFIFTPNEREKGWEEKREQNRPRTSVSSRKTTSLFTHIVVGFSSFFFRPTAFSFDLIFISTDQVEVLPTLHV